MIDLKNATQELHNEIENCYYPKVLFRTTISYEEYCDYLNIFLALHTQIEALFDHFESNWKEYNFDYNAYKRAYLLEKDLQNLDCKIDTTLKYDVQINSFSEAIGFLYVLTGSTMGGMLLSSKVEHSFHLLDYKSINNYFKAFDDQTLPMWKDFMQFLHLYLTKNETEEGKILLGARNCFTILIKGLNNGKFA